MLSAFSLDDVIEKLCMLWLASVLTLLAPDTRMRLVTFVNLQVLLWAQVCKWAWRKKIVMFLVVKVFLS